MTGTVRMKRANVILDVKVSEADRYIDLGYKQIDDKGTVIREGIPSDTDDLKAAFIAHKKEIEQLKAEIEKLKADAMPKKKVTKKSEE